MSATPFARTLLSAAAVALSIGAAQAAIVNGGFEAGPANGAPTGWTDTDSVFGFSRCSIAGCGNGGGTAGPASGSFWIWFGGDPSAQTAVLSQSAIIESNAQFLAFDLWTGATNGAPTLTLSIDSIAQWTLTQAGAGAFAAGYSTVLVPLGAFANNAAHTIRWNFSDTATPGTNTNWNLDNVRLVVPEPGSLALAGLAMLGLVAASRGRKT